jgi:lactoylglutathione lyase
MEFLHTMVRISDIDASLRFYCEGLGLKEVRRRDSEQGRFTLIFLASPDDLARAGIGSGFEGPLPAGLPMIEMTYNWDPEDYAGGRNFGHLAWRVADIYALCARLDGHGLHHPPPAARRAHGLCEIARRHLHRTPPARRRPRTRRTLGQHGE